jgi:TRAP-type C4-dicarboxylate transport system substrate-binding protein
LSEAPEIGSNGMPDLCGKRIRGAQLYREFFRGLGATYVSIKVPEVYTALERGTVAGVGWPSVGIMDLSWDNFLKFRIDPAYFQTELVILVNLDRWAAMPEEARDALQALAIEHERDSMISFQAMAKDQDAEMQTRGVEVVTLDEAAAARYRSAAIETAWTRLKTRNAKHHDALRDKFYRP